MGPSSGAVLYAVARIAEDYPGATIVAVLPDGGDRYSSLMPQYVRGR